MPKLLYLDTARLGRMSPSACRASVDFSRFAGEVGGSLYLTDFLRHGAESCSLIADDSALHDWGGVGRLKTRLKSLAGAGSESEVLIASRSATLMKLAARLLIGPCRNVLITDLTWPAYRRILRREQRTSDCRITSVALRESIFHRRVSEDELVQQFAKSFSENRCDGLFLPAVDNLGVRLPVEKIVQRVQVENEVRFVAVDGAQAFNHVPLNLGSDYCDFLLAGCHKWLQAFEPMGVGFFGNPRSVDYISDSLNRWVDRGQIDDPLLSFAHELDSGHSDRFGETVNVSPLFTANGAVADALEGQSERRSSPAANRELIVTAALDGGWNCVSPREDFASRILLFQARRSKRNASPEDLRRCFLANHVAVTAYSEGLVRVSIPNSAFNDDEQSLIQRAFAS